MAEASYPTIDHGQVNAYLFPTKATTGWTSLATPDLQYAQAQVDRLQSLGLGAFDLALRKRYEVGRTSAMEQVASSSIDKPATLEWLSYGSTTAARRMRIWNCLTGRDYTAVTDITQASFDATTSECCLVVHKLNEAKTDVIESDVLWRCVVDTIGISIPNSQDDDVRISVRLTGDEHIMAANAAGKAITFLETAVAGEVSLPASYRTIIERDDWPDDDDGTNERTLLIADPAIGATSLSVRSTTGLSAGQMIKVQTQPITGDTWETTTIATATGTTVTTNDAMDIDHGVGAEVSRTRGFFLFVYNQTSGSYLEAGTDYRVVKTDATTVKIINVDGGTAIGATDEIWACWLIASGAEMWTDNDTDLYGVTHPMTKFMISPEAAFTTTTVGYDGTAVTEDSDFEFASSGASAATEWGAFKFLAAATGKVDYVQFLMNRAGSPTGEVYCEIYTDDGATASMPSARKGNPSVPLVAYTDLTTTDAVETFYFTDGPGVTAATDYWAVLKTQGYTLDGATTNITWRFEDAAHAGASANIEVASGDPNGGGAGVPSWAVTDENSSSAEVDVALIGSQWVRRVQGMDMSVTFSRTAHYEMGTEATVERSFDETDVRITIPKYGSDNTSWSRMIQKNTASVKTARPEQNPEVWCRLEEYSTVSKNAGDIQLAYEFPTVRRSGGEKTSPANERMTERITLTGDEFTIAAAL